MTMKYHQVYCSGCNHPRNFSIVMKSIPLYGGRLEGYNQSIRTYRYNFECKHCGTNYAIDRQNQEVWDDTVYMTLAIFHGMHEYHDILVRNGIVR